MLELLPEEAAKAQSTSNFKHLKDNVYADRAYDVRFLGCTVLLFCFLISIAFHIVHRECPSRGSSVPVITNKYS